jgi:signal transduction histidine kinase
MRAHAGGTLRLTSQSGQGARIVLTVPASTSTIS